MATRDQRTGLSKKDLQAIADANNVEYKSDTSNADLEDLIEANSNVKLETAEQAKDPVRAASPKRGGTGSTAKAPAGATHVASGEGDQGEEMLVTRSPTSSSGTAAATGQTSHASDADPEDSSGTPEALGSDELLADDEDDLEDIDTVKLMGVKAIIDRVLESRGAPTTAQVPTTVLEDAKDVPPFRGEYEMSLAEAAKVKGLEPPMEDVEALGFHIRQAADPHTNTAYGPKFIVVVDVNGGKHAARL